MSPKDVSPAAMHVKTEAGAEDNARCLMLFALPAARTAKFLFSPKMTVLFIAAIVFQPKDSLQYKNPPKSGFFRFKTIPLPVKSDGGFVYAADGISR